MVGREHGALGEACRALLACLGRVPPGLLHVTREHGTACQPAESCEPRAVFPVLLTMHFEDGLRGQQIARGELVADPRHR